MMRKSTIGIVGGGLMHGIAYCSRPRGHQISVYEPNLETCTSLLQRWRQILGLFDDDKALLDRISVHDQLGSAVADAAFASKGYRSGLL